MSIKISYPIPVDKAIEEAVEDIKKQVEARTYKASNVLRNSALNVLRGARRGRRYKVPGTYARQRDKVSGKMKNGRYYTASAPGEPPAKRTGTFRRSWQPTALVNGNTYISRIESDARTDKGKYLLGEILEDGTPGGQMAPRPHHERILKHAEPKIVRIYSAPYD